MAENGERTSLEDILNEVERDGTLRESVTDTSDAPSGERAGGETPLGESGTIPDLGALLGNPELLRKIPALLRVVKSVSGGGDDRDKHPGGERGGRPASPVGLLAALRPYLGENRRRAVDTMIRVSKLSDTLRSLK